MTDDELLWDAARDVYAAPVHEFVATRKAKAGTLKSDGHPDVAARVARFAKPSAGADLVNRLVRHESGLVAETDELGARLRSAQASADAAELRTVDTERRALVGRWAERARELTADDDKPATRATVEAVEQTAWAALVDAAAAATVRAGVLVRPLSPGGFGEVDLTGASALPVEAPPQEKRPRTRRPTSSRRASGSQRAEAERAERAQMAAAKELEQAQIAHDEAQTAVHEAALAAQAAEAGVSALEQERDELTRRRAEVDDRLRAAKRETRSSTTALRDAERARRDAAAALDAAARRAGGA